MRIAPLADVKARLSTYLDECRTDGPVVITRNGKPAAVLVVPRDDEDLERLVLGRSPQFQALLDRSRQSIKTGRGLSEKDFWGAVGKRTQTRKAAKKLAGPNLEAAAMPTLQIAKPARCQLIAVKRCPRTRCGKQSSSRAWQN